MLKLLGFFCSEKDNNCDLPCLYQKEKKNCLVHCTLCCVENLRTLREVPLLGHLSQGQMAALDG